MQTPIVYYTAEETAAILKIHIVTLYKWVKCGILEGKKMGRLWRFTQEAIDRAGKTPIQKGILYERQEAPKGRKLVLPL